MDDDSDHDFKELSNVSCSNECLREFIRTYEALPVLWDSDHKDYKSRDKRNAALDKLVEVLEKVNSFATREDVKKKINSLRSNFRKELRKIEQSRRSGRYSLGRPPSWTFGSLQFLRKVRAHSKTDYNDTSAEEKVFSNQGGRLSPASTHENPERKKRRKEIKHTLFDRARNLLAQSQSQNEQAAAIAAASPADLLAALWAQKLHRLQPSQRIFAEKAIHDILFEAELNNLNRHSVQINSPLLRSHSPASTHYMETNAQFDAELSPESTVEEI